MSSVADSVFEIVDRRLAVATPEQRAEGERWYSHARLTVSVLSTFGGLTKSQIAGIIAALSPQTRWNKNVEGARRLVAAKRSKHRLPSGVTLYSTNARKAWLIAGGASPENILRGKKVVPFYRNLSGDESYVTVDTWIWKHSGLSGVLTEAKNRGIVEAYRMVAVKYNITPAQAQAVDWVIVRGRAN